MYSSTSTAVSASMVPDVDVGLLGNTAETYSKFSQAGSGSSLSVENLGLRPEKEKER